jgi:hypothetical protein
MSYGMQSAPWLGSLDDKALPHKEVPSLKHAMLNHARAGALTRQLKPSLSVDKASVPPSYLDETFLIAANGTAVLAVPTKSHLSGIQNQEAQPLPTVKPKAPFKLSALDTVYTAMSIPFSLLSLACMALGASVKHKVPSSVSAPKVGFVEKLKNMVKPESIATWVKNGGTNGVDFNHNGFTRFLRDRLNLDLDEHQNTVKTALKVSNFVVSAGFVPQALILMKFAALNHQPTALLAFSSLALSFPFSLEGSALATIWKASVGALASVGIANVFENTLATQEGKPPVRDYEDMDLWLEALNPSSKAGGLDKRLKTMARLTPGLCQFVADDFRIALRDVQSLFKKKPAMAADSQDSSQSLGAVDEVAASADKLNVDLDFEGKYQSDFADLLGVRSSKAKQPLSDKPEGGHNPKWTRIGAMLFLSMGILKGVQGVVDSKLGAMPKQVNWLHPRELFGVAIVGGSLLAQLILDASMIRTCWQSDSAREKMGAVGTSVESSAAVMSMGNRYFPVVSQYQEIINYLSKFGAGLTSLYFQAKAADPALGGGQHEKRLNAESQPEEPLASVLLPEGQQLEEALTFRQQKVSVERLAEVV